MPLAISLLGSFQVKQDEHVVAFTYDKARALLAYLAVEADKPLRREHLATLLWSEQPSKSARHNLSQALLTLRRSLRSRHIAGDSLLTAGRDAVQFNLSRDDQVDVRTFANLLHACELHPHDAIDTCPICVPRLKHAVELYQGEFLEGLLVGDSAAFEEWAVLQRERLHQQALTALQHLTHHHLLRGEYEPAEKFAARQVELEAYREEAHRDLMRIYLSRGQRTAALAQYENCRGLLAQELGVEPSEETRALYERIRAAGETRPHNLPLPLPSLIGREAELQELALRLANPECRLLCLVGPGGIGKTSLALHAAQANLSAFLDGTYFVSLVSLADPAQLPSTLTSALPLTLRGETDPKTQLLDYLRAKSMLLVLDNFEQLLPATDLLTEILKNAPHVKLLITSREVLDLSAEWVTLVQGLTYPAEESTSHSYVWYDYQAGRLFVERARRVSAGFAPTADDELHLARICRLLWGSPLGIELAAGWSSAWSCRAIADEIESDLDFLATGARDVTARHRSLRAVFEHSYHLLTERERTVLRRLSVFRNPFNRPAARAVADATAYELTALVHKSLVHVASAERYDLHPLLKQYLAKKLAADPTERDESAGRHADYFGNFLLTLVSQADRTGHYVDKVRGTEAVIQDLSAALMSAANVRESEFVTRLIKDLYDHYAGRGQYAVAKALFGQVVRTIEREAESSQDKRRILAHALGTIGACELRVGAYDEARVHLQQALGLARQLDDQFLIAFCLMSLAGIASDLGDYARAQVLAEEGVTLRRVSDDRVGLAFGLYQMGSQALEAGALVDAQVHYSQGLALARAEGHVTTLSIAIPLEGLGLIAFRRGDPQTARAHIQQSLDISRAINHRWQTADCLTDLGRIAADAGEYETAEKMLNDAIENYQAIGKRAEAALARRNRGWLEESRENYRAAGRFYSESETILEQARQKARRALALADLGRVLARLGDLAEAESYLKSAHAVFSDIGSRYGSGITLTALGMVERARGNVADARAYYLNALAKLVDSHEVYEGLKTLVELAALRVDEDQGDFSARLLRFVIHHPATPLCHRQRAESLYQCVVAQSDSKGETISRWQPEPINFDEIAKEVFAREAQA